MTTHAPRGTVMVSFENLHEFEVEDCQATFTTLWRHGNIRDWVDRQTGAKDKRISIEDSPWTAHVSGAAECLVAVVLGLKHSHRVRAPDSGYDLILPDGRKIDVKWSEHTGRLNCSQTSRSRYVADLFVLVSGPDADHLSAHGYATREELIRPETLWDFKKGPGKEAFSLRQGDLHPLILLRP